MFLVRVKTNCFKGGPRNKYSGTDITAGREPLVNDTGKAYTLGGLEKLRCPDDRACLLLGFATGRSGAKLRLRLAMYAGK